MAGLKIVIGDPETGKCEQKELSEEEARPLFGKKIGDVIEGRTFGLEQSLQITGGSDYCGFPMRKDVPGIGRKRILITKGTGFRGGGKGIKRRKTVCGNTIHSQIAQVNLRIMKPKSEKAGKEKKARKEKGSKKKREKPAEKPVESKE